MFGKNKIDTSKIEADIASLRAENVSLRAICAVMETNLNSLRGLVNKKLGKENFSDGVSNKEMDNFREFITGVPHIMQNIAAQEQQSKSLIHSTS